MEEQPNFPPPGQQNPPTDQNNYPPPGQQNPNSQNVPQQNTQYQQPQMGQAMPQQYYQQQGQAQAQFYQQPVQPMPHQQLAAPNQQMPGQQLQVLNQQMPGQQFVPSNQAMPRRQLPVQNQPIQRGFVMQAAPINPWSSELFDCAQDMENSIITFFCPCITFGQIAEITDRGMTTCSSTGVIYGLLMGFTGFHWVYSWMYRTRLRTNHSLVEDPCHDCLVHFFCEPCAMCQEYRELKHRGYNMELGWAGNMQMQTQIQTQDQVGQVVPPVQPQVQQGMAR